MSPNHAERTAALPAQPCSIRTLSAFHKGPFIRTSQIVSDRLRSSQIVPDRPGSSERTAAPRPPFPQICRNVRPIPPAKPAKKRVISRHFAPKRGNIRPQTPVRKKDLHDLLESLTLPTTGQQISASTAFLRSALTSVRLILRAKTAARTVTVTCVHHKNQMNRSLDACRQIPVSDHNRRFSTVACPLSCITIPSLVRCHPFCHRRGQLSRRQRHRFCRPSAMERNCG